jgi:hypothetical protein
MEPVDKSSSDVNNTMFVQNFISKIIQDIDVVLNPSPLKSIGGHDGAFDSTAVGMMNPTDLLDSMDKDMLDGKYWEISMYKTALEGRKGELVDGDLERDRDLEVKISNKLRQDAFLVFRALCKLSMKSLPQEATSDPVHMRGKTVDELHTPEQDFERFSRYTNLQDGLHWNRLPSNIRVITCKYRGQREQLYTNIGAIDFKSCVGTRSDCWA